MSTPTPVTLESRVAALEAKAKSWLSANWPHFLTWLGVAYSLYKKL